MKEKIVCQILVSSQNSAQSVKGIISLEIIRKSYNIWKLLVYFIKSK